MAFTYGFYNSLKGDRKYDATQLSELFDGVLADGIIASQGQHFAVTTANNGMQINVGTGRAWFDHTWSKNDSVMVLTVPLSDITRPRYDTVVLEINAAEEVRENAIKIVQGTPAVNPVKPSLVNSGKVHQYPLAYILVPAGSETVLAENIENAVGLTPTVFATGILETTPLDQLWEQWRGEWNTWFNNIKLQLSSNVVTNLQGQIDSKLGLSDKASSAEALAGTNDTKYMTPLRVTSVINNRIGKNISLASSNIIVPTALSFVNEVTTANMIHTKSYAISRSGSSFTVFTKATMATSTFTATWGDTYYNQIVAVPESDYVIYSSHPNLYYARVSPSGFSNVRQLATNLTTSTHASQITQSGFRASRKYVVWIVPNGSSNTVGIYDISTDAISSVTITGYYNSAVGYFFTDNYVALSYRTSSSTSNATYYRAIFDASNGTIYTTGLMTTPAGIQVDLHSDVIYGIEKSGTSVILTQYNASSLTAASTYTLASGISADIISIDTVARKVICGLSPITVINYTLTGGSYRTVSIPTLPPNSCFVASENGQFILISAYANNSNNSHMLIIDVDNLSINYIMLGLSVILASQSGYIGTSTDTAVKGFSASYMWNDSSGFYLSITSNQGMVILLRVLNNRMMLTK